MSCFVISYDDGLMKCQSFVPLWSRGEADFCEMSRKESNRGGHQAPFGFTGQWGTGYALRPHVELVKTQGSSDA